MAGSPGFLASGRLFASGQCDKDAGDGSFAQCEAVAVAPGGAGATNPQDATHDAQHDQDHGNERDQDQDSDRSRGFDRKCTDRSDNMPRDARQQPRHSDSDDTSEEEKNNLKHHV
jgi:hypothetical protein